MDLRTFSPLPILHLPPFPNNFFGTFNQVWRISSSKSRSPRVLVVLSATFKAEKKTKKKESEVKKSCQWLSKFEMSRTEYWLLVKTWTLQTEKSALDCLSWRVELPSSSHLVFAISIRWPGLHPEWVSIISLGGGVKWEVKQSSGTPEDSFQSFLEVYPTLPNHGSNVYSPLPRFIPLTIPQFPVWRVWPVGNRVW